MVWLIDTNVAIHFRDGDEEIMDRLGCLATLPEISIITRIELENGVYRQPDQIAIRRAALDSFLPLLKTHAFDVAELAAYSRIIAVKGYVRSRMLDRMIAATAIAIGATLITINGDDFRDIPGLSLEVWPSPALPSQP